MSQIVYEVIEHDGGWAYRAGAVVSETFATHALAHRAAEAAAHAQRAPGETTPIQYETPDGKWQEETSAGGDRPDTEVKD